MRDWHQIAFDPRVQVDFVHPTEQGGDFHVRSPEDGRPMKVIGSSGFGWDHVSVSRQDRAPTWTELEHVKRIFFKDDEAAMQLHVPPADHINDFPTCLHLWRPQAVAIPLPPKYMV